MALLVKQNIATNGTSVATAAADVAGDTVAHESNIKLMVVNGDASSITVTIKSQVATRPPTGPEDLVVTVDAGEIGIIPLGNSGYRKSSNGLVEIAYSAVTGIDVAVING